MPHRNATQQSAAFGFYPYTPSKPEVRLTGMEETCRQTLLSYMKPLLSESQDAQALQELGRASVQIVHDLKNQLNGLKLYATFLRKRMEKTERPTDEQETIGKLIAGLERAAADMSALVRFGRPLDLRRQPGIDLAKIVNTLSNGDAAGQPLSLHAEPGTFAGEFDVVALTEALKTITAGALNLLSTESNSTLTIHLRPEDQAGTKSAVIEWRGVSTNGTDPFHSFAGSDALRMSYAAKVIAAHGGETRQQADTLSVRLPIQQSDE
jgi:signal transduction histidine kinase